MRPVTWLGSPLLHFLVLGFALFVADGVWRGGDDDPRRAPLRVGATEIAQLREQSLRETGRPPTERELDFRIEAWIDDALLLREARAMGWHLTDPVVHMRLAQNQRFLGTEPDADDATLVARAFEMGMDESDVVVRRRLLERMRLAITSAAVANEPGDAELAEILAGDPDRYRRPPLVKLVHVFLSRDRRGERLAADAAALLAEIEAAGLAPAEAARRGDPSLIPSDLPLGSERSLGSRLGPHFAAAAIGLEPGRWHGPVPSAYGLHLVWVERRIEARDPDVAEARRELLATWRAQREREAMRQALAMLRAGVEVVVEDRAADPPQDAAAL